MIRSARSTVSQRTRAVGWYGGTEYWTEDSVAVAVTVWQSRGPGGQWLTIHKDFCGGVVFLSVLVRPSIALLCLFLDLGLLASFWLRASGHPPLTAWRPSTTWRKTAMDHT